MANRVKHFDTFWAFVSIVLLMRRHSSTNSLEALTAQQSLLEAEQSQFDKIQEIIYHALGGGIQ